MYKKTIILSDNDKNNRGLATLVLEKSSKGNIATLKAYNLKDKDTNFLLGINSNGKNVVKQNVSFIKDTFSFRLPNNIALDSKLACVLTNSDIEPVLWGCTSNVAGDYKSSVCSCFDKPNVKELSKDQDIEDVKQELLDKMSHKSDEVKTNSVKDDVDNKSSLFEPVSDSELDQQIDRVVNTKNISEIFEEETDKDTSTPFFDRIKDEVQDLFSKYPQDSELENMIPNSKWVRIDYQNDGHYYVLGLLYKDSKLQYLAYGIPQITRGKMPDELVGYGRWVPLDPDNADDEGYYMVYQDVSTGKNIEL